MSCLSAALRSMKLATMSASVGNRLDAADGIGEFRRRLRQQLQRFDGLLAQVEPAGFDLAVDDGGFPVRLDAGDQERIAAHVIEHREPLLALGDQMMPAVARRDEADDRGRVPTRCNFSAPVPRSPRSAGPIRHDAACARPPELPRGRACR